MALARVAAHAVAEPSAELAEILPDLGGRDHPVRTAVHHRATLVVLRRLRPDRLLDLRLRRGVLVGGGRVAFARLAFRPVERLVRCTTSQADRPRGEVDRDVLRTLHPGGSEETHQDEEHDDDPGRPAEEGVAEVEVQDVVTLDHARRLPGVGVVVLHRRAALEVAVATGGHHDDAHAAHAPRGRDVRDERREQRDPEEDHGASDGGRDVAEEVELRQLLGRRLGVVLVAQEADEEGRDPADEVDALLQQREADEVEHQNHDEPHPVAAPVHRGGEDAGHHPRHGQRGRHQVERDERRDHLQDPRDERPEDHAGATEDDHPPGGVVGEVRQPGGVVDREINHLQEVQEHHAERQAEAARTEHHATLDLPGPLERARRLEAGEEVQAIHEIERRVGRRGAGVPLRVADEDELDDGDEVADEVRCRLAPRLPARARRVAIALQPPHLLEGQERVIEVPTQEQGLDVRGVVLQGLDEAGPADSRIALELGDDVAAGLPFDPEDPEQVQEGEHLVGGEPARGEGLLDLGLRHRRKWGGGGGSGGCCGGCCVCGHGSSDGRVGTEAVPVRDEVGTGFRRGLAGDEPQGAAGSGQHLEQLAEQLVHPAAPLEALRGEQDERPGDFGNAGEGIKEHAEDVLGRVRIPETIGDRVGDDPLRILAKRLLDVGCDGISHGNGLQSWGFWEFR